MHTASIPTKRLLMAAAAALLIFSQGASADAKTFKFDWLGYNGNTGEHNVTGTGSIYFPDWDAIGGGQNVHLIPFASTAAAGVTVSFTVQGASTGDGTFLQDSTHHNWESFKFNYSSNADLSSNLVGQSGVSVDFNFITGNGSPDFHAPDATGINKITTDNQLGDELTLTNLILDSSTPTDPTPNPAPEPATLALFGVGLAALRLGRRPGRAAAAA